MAHALTQGLLDKNNQYILVCRSGNRSKIAAANLTELGYSSVYNLSGGLALTG
jgi:rhodanese-related sulfurtransferase